MKDRVRGLLLLVPLLLAAVPPGRPSPTRGTVLIDGRVSVVVEVARSGEDQGRGLSGRSALGRNEGMLFVYPEAAPRSIWMKEMRFPLDILWIARGRVQAVEEQVPPPVGSAPLPVYTHHADLVLEVNAGFVRAHRITLGQRVEVRWP